MSAATHLEVGVDNSQNFLRAWLAWRADPGHPHMLHFVAVCGDSYQNTGADAALKPLAEQLDAQLWGLLPGFHRLVFEGGHVLFTLCIGDIAKVLRQQQFEADSIYLNHADLTGADPLYIAKAIARLCRPGTLLTTPNHAALQAALRQCGFVVDAGNVELQATYNPAWVAKQRSQPVKPGSCVVIGAGLAGAAVANSLARRGWAVTVVDTASAPASSASSLPAGLLVPHTSPDDSPLSRLSRSGVRMTLQQARAQLSHGIDWGHTGVLQRNPDGNATRLPPGWADKQLLAASDWCYPASNKALATAGVPANDRALWHAQAGWLKPAALVKAWLTAPGIAWRAGVQAVQLRPVSDGWQLLDAEGVVQAQADLVVLCAGFASQALASSAGISTPNLQAIRGQVTFGLHSNAAAMLPLPPFAVNGHGNLIPAVTTPDGPMWLMGASYERDVQVPAIKAQDHADNLLRLQRLLSDAALAMAGQFDPLHARGWAGIRCATSNRLPMVARVDQNSGPGLWLSTGMGSRGLSFAALCGELLAARLHGEPLPIESQLAIAMSGHPVNQN